MAHLPCWAVRGTPVNGAGYSRSSRIGPVHFSSPDEDPLRAATALSEWAADRSAARSAYGNRLQTDSRRAERWFCSQEATILVVGPRMCVTRPPVTLGSSRPRVRV